MLKYLAVSMTLLLVACAELTPPSPLPTSAKPTEGVVRPQVCQCSPNFETLGCNSGDIDDDCVCNNEDNCHIVPNCDRANADGDAFGDVCDEMPNTPSPETAIAALDTRIDALETAQATVTALQADVALLVTALAEVRTKYPEHFHGLLGINGDPVGDNGDLGYALPGDQ
jgi:hypothetical protein